MRGFFSVNVFVTSTKGFGFYTGRFTSAGEDTTPGALSVHHRVGILRAHDLFPKQDYLRYL